jgi:formylglycine-generating enzyme required for sulfatase activity
MHSLGTEVEMYEGDFHRNLNALSPDQANFARAIGRPCAVGLCRPNRLGLHDMHGNVWELCENRGQRGGCWCDPADRVRVTVRLAEGPAFKHANHGFRVAWVPIAR